MRKWFPYLLTAVFFGFIMWVVWAAEEDRKYWDACTHRGGIRVVSHTRTHLLMIGKALWPQTTVHYRCSVM